MNTITATLRSDKRKNPEVKTYRFLTADECRSLTGRVKALDQFGKIGEVTITSVKTWKTRPEVQVNWKFGLYEYGKELIETDEDNRFFVAEVC